MSLASRLALTRKCTINTSDAFGSLLLPLGEYGFTGNEPGTAQEKRDKKLADARDKGCPSFLHWRASLASLSRRRKSDRPLRSQYLQHRLSSHIHSPRNGCQTRRRPARANLRAPSGSHLNSSFPSPASRATSPTASSATYATVGLVGVAIKHNLRLIASSFLGYKNSFNDWARL